MLLLAATWRRLACIEAANQTRGLVYIQVVIIIYLITLIIVTISILLIRVIIVIIVTWFNNSNDIQGTATWRRLACIETANQTRGLVDIYIYIYIYTYTHHYQVCIALVLCIYI